MSGYYIRTNDIFKKDLKELVSLTSTPCYLIVNEKGLITDENAKRPSQMAELIKDLDN